MMDDILQRAESIKRGLAPIINATSHTLILGTLPGDRSLKTSEYYANRNNQFWLIMEGIYREHPGTIYESKINFLKAKGIALWDVLQSAQRRGSSDGKIRNGVPNDFDRLFATYPSLARVILAGGTCQKTWQKIGIVTEHITVMHVPSSSGTPGKNVRSLEENDQPVSFGPRVKRVYAAI